MCKALIFVFLCCSVLFAQGSLSVGGGSAGQFEVWLTKQAEGYWAKREEAVQGLSTAAQIRERQGYVRRTMLELIGGLPTEKTPLNGRVTGSLARDGYRVENVIFESQPGFQVTANLYLPTVGRGPFPAILGVAGHSVNGKAAATYQAAFIGFVRQGFAVLAFDPPGQGERLEYLDAETGRSRPGAGVAEHNMAGLQTLLTGQTLARYFVWDGIRAFDYLLTRPEIDPGRIAVAGNSGGGTQAAYLAVFEPRLAAVVSSCYMTRWRELWAGPGPQDAEQVFPGFVEKGLDFGDFMLAQAPRPFLMTTAMRDYFPIAGARMTYKQNQRLFDLLGQSEKAGYFEFDDTHGWSQPRREAAARFLAKSLQGRETEGRESAVLTEEESVLFATPTGQVSGATVRSLNLREARRLGAGRSVISLETVRAAIGWRGTPAVPDGLVRGERLELRVEGGVAISAVLLQPETVRRAVVFTGSLGKGEDADVSELVRGGAMVLAVEPRGSTGKGYPIAARAMLLGRNLVEMQAADLVAAARYLETRTKAPLALYARGSLGPAAAFAAALYAPIGELVVERSIVSYLDVVAASMHVELERTVVPGILGKLDLPEVLSLIGPRRVTLVSPVMPNGRMMMQAEVSERVSAGVRVVMRGEGWSLRRTLPQWDW